MDNGEEQERKVTLLLVFLKAFPRQVETLQRSILQNYNEIGSKFR